MFDQILFWQYLYNSKGISMSEISLCSSTYDDITDFEICGFEKKQYKNLDISRTKHHFFQIKKIMKYASRATLW